MELGPCLEYSPRLNWLFGNPIAALLFVQIVRSAEEAGRNTEGLGSFFRFKTPPSKGSKETDESFLERVSSSGYCGDSWCEVLGVSAFQIDGAIKAVCTRVKSGESLDKRELLPLSFKEDQEACREYFASALKSCLHYRVTASRLTQYSVDLKGVETVLEELESYLNPGEEDGEVHVLRPSQSGWEGDLETLLEAIWEYIQTCRKGYVIPKQVFAGIFEFVMEEQHRYLSLGYVPQKSPEDAYNQMRDFFHTRYSSPDKGKLRGRDLLGFDHSCWVVREVSGTELYRPHPSEKGKELAQMYTRMQALLLHLGKARKSLDSFVRLAMQYCEEFDLRFSIDLVLSPKVQTNILNWEKEK